MRCIETIFLFLFLFLLISEKTAWAEDFGEGLFPELLLSPRALAMGNAHIARANDHYAVFYNPAGLGSVRRTKLHIGFLLEFNNHWLDINTEGRVDEAAANITNPFKLEELRQTLLGHWDRASHTRSQALLHFTTRFFSAGYFYARQSQGIMREGPPPLFEFAYRVDHGPYGAFNLSFWGGIIKIGVTGLWAKRQEVVGELPGEQPLELGNNENRRGEGLIVNGGLKATLPTPWLPTLALHYHNALNRSFSPSASHETQSLPGPIKQSLDAGLSLTPQISRHTRLHIEVNHRDLGQEYSEIERERKTTLGIEVDIVRLLFFRLGYGKEFHSVGIGFKGFGSSGLRGLRGTGVEFDLTAYSYEKDQRFILSFFTGL